MSTAMKLLRAANANPNAREGHFLASEARAALQKDFEDRIPQDFGEKNFGLRLLSWANDRIARGLRA
jgi:hypothetical protein